VRRIHQRIRNGRDHSYIVHSAMRRRRPIALRNPPAAGLSLELTHVVFAFILERWDDTYSKGEKMHSFGFRTALVALIALLGASLTSVAHADEGWIRIKVVKGGWFVGASGGSGTLTFHGQTYPLAVGGVSAGLVFGAAETYLQGRVHHIHQPSDVAGVYGAGAAGAAVGRGVQAIVLTNEKGAVLELSGRERGLMVNADLSGLAISLR
jgi:hypothetical protein